MKKVATKLKGYTQTLTTTFQHPTVDEHLLRSVATYVGAKNFEESQAIIDCTDSLQMAEVRHNYLVRYLRLPDSQALTNTLDTICSNAQNGKIERTVLYYLLAKQFAKEEHFDHAQSLHWEWHKVANAAQAKELDWDNEVLRKSGVTLDEALSIAQADNEITFFFYMKEPMFLEGKAGANGWTEKGKFKSGDAVFFSGTPSYGSATQADAYEKRSFEWVKVPNVAQYKGASWQHEVMRTSNTSVEEAREIAAANPKISYFFYMESNMVLEGKGAFHPGDAVYFSGKPWYGSAPQANAYEKRIVEWTMVPNVAQYKGANWDNEVCRKQGITLQEAKRIAEADPSITYFFQMEGSFFLEGKSGPDGWTEKGAFGPGDTVFFSGKPWYGSAPQANGYEKKLEKLTSFVPEDNNAPVDLKEDKVNQIEGIGPKTATKLKEAGYTTFKSIAVAKVADLKAVLKAAGTHYNFIDPTTWPEQAQLAAEGKWEALKKLQEELKGGKRK